MHKPPFCIDNPRNTDPDCGQIGHLVGGPFQTGIERLPDLRDQPVCINGRLIALLFALQDHSAFKIHQDNRDRFIGQLQPCDQKCVGAQFEIDAGPAAPAGVFALFGGDFLNQPVPDHISSDRGDGCCRNISGMCQVNPCNPLASPDRVQNRGARPVLGCIYHGQTPYPLAHFYVAPEINSIIFRAI